MATLYNSQTRRPETLPEDQIESAIASGSHGYLVTDRVNLRKKNGETVSLPGSEVTDALQSGEYSLELPTQTAVREYVEENKGIGGQLKTAVMQFADEALMGVPELIADKKQDPLEIAKRQALKEENVIANTLGGIGGFGASLLYGGPVGKMATIATRAGEKAIAGRLATAGATTGAQSAAKELAKKIARSSAQMGVEGVTFAAPTAITEAALGDPELAAETLLVNGLAGGAIGALGRAGSEVLKLGANKIAQESAEKGFLEAFRDERAAKALGFSKGQIKKLKGGQQEAEEIGAAMLELTDAQGKKIIGALDSPETIQANIKRAKNEVGEKLGAYYDEIDNTGVKTFDTEKLAETVEKDLGSFFKSALNKDEVRVYENTLEAIKKLGGENGLSTLRQAKELLDQVDAIAFPGGKPPLNPTAKQTLAKDVRKILRDQLNETVDTAAGSLIGKKGVINEIKKNNKLYSQLTKAERAIDDKVSSMAGNKYIGLTDTITGAGTIGAIGAPGAIATVAAKKFIEKYGNQIAANTAGVLYAQKSMAKVAKKLDEIPEKIDSMLKGRRLTDVAKTTSVGAIQRLIENAESGMSRVAAFEKLKEDLSEIEANPALPMDRSARLSEPLSNTGAPETASQLTLKNGLIAKYLSDHMPKPITVNTPFKQVKWTPSDQELSRFERRVHAIQNPLSVVDDLVNGTLTTEAIDAVKVVYPKLFENIPGRVMQYFMDNPQTVSYNNRIKLSLLLDMPLDDALKPENLQRLQQNFMEQDESAAAQQSAGTKPFKVPEVQTSTQAVAMS